MTARTHLDPNAPSATQTSRSLSSLSTDGSVVNSTTNTALGTLAVPKTAAAGDCLRLVALGDMLNNSGSSVNYTWTVTLGATTLHTLGAFGISASAQRRKWRLEVDLLVVATNDQRSGVVLQVGGASAVAVSQHGVDRATATENLTAGKNLIVGVTMGTAAATADAFLHEAFLTVLKR